jgi:hypothetical protein
MENTTHHNCKINWLTLLAETIAVYSDNCTKLINPKCSITGSEIKWYI